MSEINFAEQNSTNFPMSVKTNLEAIYKSDYKKGEFLKYHQFIIYKYLINNPKSRGILLFHEMGMGKSITAVSLAEYYRKHDPNRKIIILLPKSLKTNFEKNIDKFIKEEIKESIKDTKIDKNEEAKKILDERYKFVSLNASNMFQQVVNVDKTKQEKEIDKQIKSFTDIIEKDDFLENSLLIIDEYHNLSNSIANGSYNAIRLYDHILKTKNIKLLFLTGTPIVNHPFELVSTFNMLNGLIKIDERTNITLFPELEKDFNNFFIDYKKNTIKNASKFQNRIVGMVSYYGSIYFDKTQDGYPKQFPIKVERVNMSSEQYARYNMARDFEIEEQSYKKKRVSAERFSQKSGATATYRVKSRQVSNFMFPEYALGPLRGKKERNKYPNKIKDSDLNLLQIYSPKFKKILYNINNHKDELGLFYSEFVSGAGIAVFAKVLNVNGYKSYNKQIKLSDDENSFDISFDKSNKSNKFDKLSKVKNKYAIITGDVSFEERSKIVKIFNSKENINGKKIKLLLISKTGAEGLDLKNVRHVHICEPYWNYARISQIIARSVRYLSHIDLPEKSRTVQPYIYLSDYPIDFDIKKKKEPTTDIELYKNSLKGDKIIKEFYRNLAEASIDCNLHYPNFSKEIQKKINCKMCLPNDKELYNISLSKQLLLPDPCDALKTEEIKAKEISINGKKYYYSKDKDDINIFYYDKSIDGYLLMKSNNPIYADIMNKVLMK